VTATDLHPTSFPHTTSSEPAGMSAVLGWLRATVAAAVDRAAPEVHLEFRLWQEGFAGDVRPTGSDGGARCWLRLPATRSRPGALAPAVPPPGSPAAARDVLLQLVGLHGAGTSGGTGAVVVELDAERVPVEVAHTPTAGGGRLLLRLGAPEPAA
jgi:hypothetical protein